MSIHHAASQSTDMTMIFEGPVEEGTDSTTFEIEKTRILITQCLESRQDDKLTQRDAKATLLIFNRNDVIKI